MKTMKQYCEEAAAAMLEIRDKHYNMTPEQEAAVLLAAAISAHADAVRVDKTENL